MALSAGAGGIEGCGRVGRLFRANSPPSPALNVMGR
jgi:hypothetical protein